MCMFIVNLKEDYLGWMGLITPYKAVIMDPLSLISDPLQVIHTLSVLTQRSICMGNNFSWCIKQEQMAQDQLIPVLEARPKERTRDFNWDLCIKIFYGIFLKFS